MRRTAHFTVNTLALRRGGLVKAVRTRANALAAAGALEEVWLEVLGFQARLDTDVVALRRGGHLHPKVKVRSVLYSLDGSPRTERRKPVRAPADPDLVAVAVDASGRSIRYYRDGLPEMDIRFGGTGLAAAIDRFDAAGLRTRREEMDGDGRLVRILHYSPGAGTPSIQRYIGRDGHCFLMVRQKPGSEVWADSCLFGASPRSFADMGDLYQYALEHLLAVEDAPAICSEFRDSLDNIPGRNLDDIVGSLRHPNLLRIAVAHSNHLEAPYVAGSGVSPNWKRLILQLDAWDSLVVWTEAQRRDFSEDFGHGELLEVVRPAAPEPRPTASRTDPNRLVLVARTHPKKRVDEAIRVLHKVLDGNPAAVLEVYGLGSKSDEEAKIHALIAELGVGDSVRFMPFAEDPATIYPGACATVFTSASEGFGLVLLESMACGVPVMAYDSNYGPREVIADGVNGYLAPFGDHDALAARILQLMGDPGLRERLAEGSRATLAGFNEARFVARWTEVLSRPGRPGRAAVRGTDPFGGSAHWAGDTLILPAADQVPEGTELLVRKRSEQDGLRIPMTGRTWHVLFARSGPQDIFDFFIAEPGHGKEQRLAFGQLDVVQRPPLRIYATENGNLSVKHTGPASLTGRLGRLPAVRRLLRVPAVGALLRGGLRHGR
ncbi:glycosyltransferase [Arthrobacter sp. I2-34]|uniref:Glycosyltransferase n=1 Tax=Arthrobacter hankyongi TaxID=2904801 RepID=A0ABS9LDF9_9MICC|nr:glycosyltransferase [Arthrobacter hankyongi]MCG2624658.1 glycosyltransferase [Arthrobacter hankyongi]